MGLAEPYQASSESILNPLDFPNVRKLCIKLLIGAKNSGQNTLKPGTRNPLRSTESPLNSDWTPPPSTHTHTHTHTHPHTHTHTFIYGPDLLIINYSHGPFLEFRGTTSRNSSIRYLFQSIRLPHFLCLMPTICPPILLIYISGQVVSAHYRV